MPDFKAVLEVSRLIPVFILLAAFGSLALVSKGTALDVLELPDFGGATTVGARGTFTSLGSCLVMPLLVFGSVFGLVITGASG